MCTYILRHDLEEIKFRWMTMLFHWIGFLLKQKGSYPCIEKLKVTQWGNHGLQWLLEASGTRWVQLFKTNFDGAMFHDFREAGIGVVIRKNKGEVMTALSEKIPRPPYSSWNISARQAVLFVRRLGNCHQFSFGKVICFILLLVI